MSRGGKVKNVRVHGASSTNDGETALSWALDGHGVILATEWNTAEHVRSGALQVLLPDWTPPLADVYVVYLRQKNISARIKAFNTFLLEWFSTRRATRMSHAT